MLSCEELRTHRRRLDAEGVVVIPNAVPMELCQKAARAIEGFLGKRVGDSTTWHRPPGLRYHGLISGNQHQALWDTRTHPNLHRIFSHLLGSERLRVSADSTNFTPPALPGVWESVQHIHWDVDSSKVVEGTLNLQGVLCLEDCAADQGGLVCVPGFHRQLQEWGRAQPKGRNVEVPTLDDVAGWELRYIAAPAGSIIIWNSAIPHSNSRNTARQPRLAQYISFTQMTHDPQPESISMPLARTHADVVASALGVHCGSVIDWLHAHAQSDTLLVPCESVEIMPMQDGLTPYWLRVKMPGREQLVDLHSQWSSVQQDGSYKAMAKSEQQLVAVQWPFLGRLGLSTEQISAMVLAQAEASAAARDASISDMPMPESSSAKASARLDTLQVQKLSNMLISNAPWRHAPVVSGPETDSKEGRVWTASSIAELIGREFGPELVDTVPAKLSELGQKLVGVRPWTSSKVLSVRL
eukprot:SAG31_NODE_315_length_17848_cov_18.145811_3_plen_468_part_00